MGSAFALGANYGERLADDQRQFANEKREAALKVQLAPLSQALQADQTRLALYADANDPSKPQPGKENEYHETLNRMTQTIGQMRSMLGQKAPSEDPNAALNAGAHILDRLHITRDLAGRLATRQSNKVNDYYAQNRNLAAATAAGALPYEMTPEAQKEEQRIEGEVRVAEARLQAGGWTKNGPPVKVNGQWVQPFVNKMGETMMNAMPAGYNGPQTKYQKGTVIRSKQSPTGFAQTYVDPTDPGKIAAWEPITPNRYYTGLTTKSSTTDPFGVTTTSVHTTNPTYTGDVDLSGAVELPAQPDAPSQPPASPASSPSATTATPAAAPPANPSPKPAAVGPKTKQLHQVRQRTSGEKQLDANGDIPASDRRGNDMLRSAANQYLHGMAIKDLQIPEKDKPAVVAWAKEYGYEQGKFTPRERSQIQESQSLIRDMSRDEGMMSVYSAGPLKRGLISHIIKTPDEKGVTGSIRQAIEAKTLNENDKKFIQNYRQLIGRIQGIASLTRGAGRPTEQAIRRMIGELPDPSITDSPEMAQKAFDLVNNEIDIGLQTGDWSPAPRQQSQPAGGVNWDALPKN